MVGVLCEGPDLSSSTRWDRYWFKSPHSMYSVTMQRGSLLTHTPSSLMMFGSFRRDRIFTSFRKSFLPGRDRRVTCVSEEEGWSRNLLDFKESNFTIADLAIFLGI